MRIEFSVIVTFRQAEQDGLVMSFKKPPTEAELLAAIREHLGRVRKFEGQSGPDYDICKFSICQMGCRSAEDAMPWLLASSGKYYFEEGK